MADSSSTDTSKKRSSAVSLPHLSIVENGCAKKPKLRGSDIENVCPTENLRRICVKCSQSKPRDGFTKTQFKKAAKGKGSCNDCLIIAQLLSKPGRRKHLYRCEYCGGHAKKEKFPRQEKKIDRAWLLHLNAFESAVAKGWKPPDPESSKGIDGLICGQCLAAICTQCNMIKPGDHFNDVVKRRHAQEDVAYTCLTCVKRQYLEKVARKRVEKQEQQWLLVQQKPTPRLRSANKQSISFYTLSSVYMRCQNGHIDPFKVPHTIRPGSYAVIFHQGCIDDDNHQESRTTSGFCELWSTGENDDETAGLVKFPKALETSPVGCFRRDFTIAQVRGQANNFEVKLVDNDGVHYDAICGDLSVCTSRSACPLMKHENLSRNTEMDDIAKFHTVEEAVSLQKTRSTSRTLGNPVFFIEPGDLRLTIGWNLDAGKEVLSTYILRPCRGRSHKKRHKK